ncbi:MAG: acyl-CoA dehydratase activase-related protein [Clostridiales bacterium]|nr:acyl-CoA dehydratase activase-related protein [Clostridiales bacterium]
MTVHLGLDVGSTTVKLVALDGNLKILFKTYRRHMSDVKNTIKQVVEDCFDTLANVPVTINVTGSGGLFVNKHFKIPFIQEVVALSRGISTFIADTDVAIELGGEDSKIIYLKGSVESRMNSICAGGTGAFIDQMASLLKTDAEGLNKYAEKSEKIYPMASRCGVFAKTDVQALINQGASKEDISVSVLQSVVNQTISNLACGRPIKGKVAFLGGPLHFLPELKKRFIETLNLHENEIITPEDGEIFIAKGAAVASVGQPVIDFLKLRETVNTDFKEEASGKTLSPLFKDEESLAAFRKRHSKNSVSYGDIRTYKGPMYIGIDSGSTTSKLVVLSENNEILYSHYTNNGGDPLAVIIEQMKYIYKIKTPESFFRYSGVTGYGEDFIKAALNLDTGEVETVAHFEAAKYFDPLVDFVIDIGGQDMKTMKIQDGVIDSILLNEACSSGCGSFLETFAHSIGLDAEQFSELALMAENPVDLGSRCTVFMNSNVKQAQKEGAAPSDIAAGLAYSVIKNAIQKVIKIRNTDELGEHIVVQGGTFLSEAVLRAFENLTGREVTRPVISGLMGAFGIALIAKRRSAITSKNSDKPEAQDTSTASGKSSILSLAELENFTYRRIDANCGKCSNNCRLKINIFPNNKRFITGNRCERGDSRYGEIKEKLPNLYAEKYDLLFNRKSLPREAAHRGAVGIPRVLNMYENYPFWHTFFTTLGFRVVLSDETTRNTYEKGIETIPSETACYPAKLVHGHIENLLEKARNAVPADDSIPQNDTPESGVSTDRSSVNTVSDDASSNKSADKIDFIFYPAVFYEEKNFNKQTNNLNCPVVCGYSEVIRNNMDFEGIPFLNPFISLKERRKLPRRLSKVFPRIPRLELEKASKEAYKELDSFRRQMRTRAEEALRETREKGHRAVILCGRPYHLDKEINHGIPELLTTLGLGVLTEDAIPENFDIKNPLRVLDQWTYHARLYRAASYVGQTEDLEMVQLNSFGCGLDAITTDQVHEILHHYGKIHTVLKIDEVNNLGAVKIRIRSLIETIENREVTSHDRDELKSPVLFTEENRKNHTILMPQMAPIHFSLISSLVQDLGFNLEILKDLGPDVINMGLKYVNNDACYPSMFVVGQFLEAVKSGKYDTDNLSLVISQTGGACRASNYVGLIRKALADAGYGHVPVIALSFQGIEKHPGVKISRGKLIELVKRLIISLQYGDLIQRCVCATRPYEKEKGATNIVRDKWIEILSKDKNFSTGHFKSNMQNMIDDFSAIETLDIMKPKVGIVGEILVKYLPEANNFLIEKLEEEGAEAVISDLTDFMLYSFKNPEYKSRDLSSSKLPALLSALLIHYVEYYRKTLRACLKDSKYEAPGHINKIADYAERFVSLTNQYGEGWLLTGEMVDLIEHGVKNIICVQPFGCLPNHITGKGIIKAIRERYDNINIVPIDFDASASEVNQFNRIKLMLSVAEENMRNANQNREYMQEVGHIKKINKKVHK